MAFMFIMLRYCKEKLDFGHVRSRKRLQQLVKVLVGATLNCMCSFVRFLLLLLFMLCYCKEKLDVDHLM